MPKNPIRISSILEDRHETSEFQKQLLEQSHPLLRFYQEPIHLQLKLQNQVVPIEIYPIKRKMLFYIIYSSGTPWPHYDQSTWLILKSQLITYFYNCNWNTHGNLKNTNNETNYF